MKHISFILLLLLAIPTLGQNKLTPAQIKKRNYMEVVGDTSTVADTIKPNRYAMYPDGLIGISKHIARNIKYPQNALNNGIQGKVYIKILVDIDGLINNIEVVKSINPELDKEAIRVLKKMQEWVPAVKDGKPVKVEYTIPFHFKI